MPDLTKAAQDGKRISRQLARNTIPEQEVGTLYYDGEIVPGVDNVVRSLAHSLKWTKYKTMKKTYPDILKFEFVIVGQQPKNIKI